MWNFFRIFKGGWVGAEVLRAGVFYTMTISADEFTLGYMGTILLYTSILKGVIISSITFEWV